MGGIDCAVFAPAFPQCFGHVLLMPHFEEVRPMIMTEELMLCGLRIVSSTGTYDFRLLYSSQHAGENRLHETVNHFFFHAIYCHYFSSCLTYRRLPIEWVPRCPVTGDSTAGRIRVEMLVEAKWMVRGIIITGGCKLNDEASRYGA